MQDGNLQDMFSDTKNHWTTGANQVQGIIRNGRPSLQGPGWAQWPVETAQCGEPKWGLQDSHRETASEKLILTHNSPQRLWSWPGGSHPRVLEPYSTSLTTESDPKNPVKLEGAQCPLSPQHAMAPTNPLNKIIILFQKSKRSIHNQVRLTKPLQPTPSY